MARRKKRWSLMTIGQVAIGGLVGVALLYQFGTDLQQLQPGETRRRVAGFLMTTSPKHNVTGPRNHPTAVPMALNHSILARTHDQMVNNQVGSAWHPHAQPVHLELRLPNSVLQQRALGSREAMFHQYGFNLNVSNYLPLAQPWPDPRNAACKAREWPSVHEMPKASVIIIFYNEPLSTLLRNVVAVLNRSPPELIGEILLIDDRSQLGELTLLPEHLDRLQLLLPPEKVRLVRRKVHNGIVGARNEGAREARYPILVILDSHVQVCDGWLEPLIGRIYGNRKRVVVPNLLPIDINTMQLVEGSTWPPHRGSFNWRLTFDIIYADPKLDIVEEGIDKTASAVKSPVMPGGLFAMDREYFFELGEYDPEILYYGAEHIELSFRLWMCGGTMETMPCSHIGHVYREFDRFVADPLLNGVDIRPVLDRNDARVAEVWMDDYKRLFYRYRPMPGRDLGDLQPRKDLRHRLQCKSFQWYLDTVCRDKYVPELDDGYNQLYVDGTGACIDGLGKADGPVQARGCDQHAASQYLAHTAQGYLEFTTQGAVHICIRVISAMMVDCENAAAWELYDNGEIRSVTRPGMCLSRSPEGTKVEIMLKKCSGMENQRWVYNKDARTLTDPDGSWCLDDMQQRSGPVAACMCHGGETQQWVYTADRHITSVQLWSCLGLNPQAVLSVCQTDDLGYMWKWKGQHLAPAMFPEYCLVMVPNAGNGQPEVGLTRCVDIPPGQQTWRFGESEHEVRLRR